MPGSKYLMPAGQLMSAAAKISLPAKLVSIDVSCINNTPDHIQNNIISNTIHAIQQARTECY